MVPPKYHWYVEGVALHSAPKALCSLPLFYILYKIIGNIE